MALFRRRRKHIAVIGGGTGSYTVLKGLKEYDLDLTAIVNVTDDGGSSGVLRDEFGVLPPGDLRRCIAALSNSSKVMKTLFQYRFPDGSVNNHSMGNLIITALQDITQSDTKAIEEASRIFSVKGRVLPVTLTRSRLHATLENGETIHGESNIDVPKHDGNLRIREVYLKPIATAYPEAVEALSRSDIIVIGPGDLYSSIIPTLLVHGIPEAIRKSKARRVYVCNLMTKFGETNDFQVHDFVDRINHHVPFSLDYIVYNDPLSFEKKVLESYASENAHPVKVSDHELRRFGVHTIQGSFASPPPLARHDSRKLAKTIVDILKWDY